jgi:organic hydroperoxide reductase OsmC/OhrA
MTIIKDHQFRAAVRWVENGVTVAAASGKPLLRVGLPPDFRGAHPELWGPEELLVGSVAASFALTFAAVADRGGIVLDSLEVEGVAHVERDRNGSLGVVAIDLRATIASAEGSEEAVEAAAHEAERASIVVRALDAPVHLALDVRTGGRGIHAA